MKQIGVLLLSVFFVTSCDAQNKPFVKDSVYTPGTNGSTAKIPKTASSKDNNVHSAQQDKEGNLWFGTTGNGIYRYDGKTFVNYTDKDGIGSNKVNTMLEDKNGFIWIGTDAGLSRYDPSAKTFTRMALPEKGGAGFFVTGNAAPPIQVTAMMQDKNGRMWFGTMDDGVLCFGPVTEKIGSHTLIRFKWSGVKNESNLKLNAVNCITQDKTGAIWFATWFEGLCRYDGKSITSFKPNNEVWFASMLEDKDGTMWVGRRSHGMFRFDPTAVAAAGALNHTNVLQHGTLDSCFVGFLLQDKSGIIWLSSMHSNLTRRDESGGLWRFDPSASGAARFKNITASDGLPSNNVWSAVQDNAGFIWLGTYGTGLYRFNPSAQKTGSNTFESFSD